LLENWIDESEKRTWFLFECTRHARSHLLMAMADTNFRIAEGASAPSRTSTWTILEF
jgi:hypothetical protein